MRRNSVPAPHPVPPAFLRRLLRPAVPFPAPLFCHELGLGHVDLSELLIVVGTVGTGADDQLEQLQLALLQVSDLKLHSGQAQCLFFSRQDSRNTGFHRISGYLRLE